LKVQSLSDVYFCEASLLTVCQRATFLQDWEAVLDYMAGYEFLRITDLRIMFPIYIVAYTTGIITFFELLIEIISSARKHSRTCFFYMPNYHTYLFIPFKSQNKTNSTVNLK
jgi:DNA phosphorothioation-dependent restriction protein DptG